MILRDYTLSKTKTVMVAGLLLIGVGLVCNEWVLTAIFSSDGILSPRSVLIIWGFNVTAVVVGMTLALSRSIVTLLNLFIGVALTVLLLYGLERLFYRINHPPPSPDAAAPGPPIHHEGSYTKGFFHPDDLLGYRPRPNVAVTSLKKAGDDVIYDVVYSIDPYHRRITPASNAEQQSRFILFFGGSFVFGEGVNDNETLPFHVSEQAPGYRVYNYGFSGYGPQQMLAKLESDDLADEVPEAGGMAIYVFIDGHVERALGSMFVYNAWGDQMPYYFVDWRGNLVRKGSFATGRPLRSTLYSVLGKSEIATYYNVNIPATLQDRHYGFAARVIAEARNAFQARYQSEAFYVLIYPDEGDYVEDMIPHFEQYGLKYLNYDERLKLDVEQGLAIAGDGHPTSETHRMVAEWIVTELNLEAIPQNE